MNRKMLILLTLVPVAAGELLNRMVLVPGLGMLLYYLLPFVTLIFWFFLGSRYSKSGWNLAKSALIGNGAGFLSLILYIWQFLLCGDDTRNIFLAGFSQSFTSNTNLFTARIAMIFEAEKNTISQTSVTAAQILGLILMVFIFIAGYCFGKRNDFSKARRTQGS